MGSTKKHDDVFVVITDDDKGAYDFQLVKGKSLPEFLKKNGGSCCRMLDIRLAKQDVGAVFYTVFDNGADGWPDENYPFTGMIQVFTCQNEMLEALSGNHCLIWMKRGGDRWTAFDYDDYVEMCGVVAACKIRKELI